MMKNRFEILVGFAHRIACGGGRPSRPSGLLPLVVPAVVLLLQAGCSQGEARVPVYPVTGKVTVAGEAPAGALVVLYPTGGGEGALRPSGKVKADGSFALTTYEGSDGAPEGDYVATIQWYKLVKRGESYSAGPNVIAKEYGERDSSVWKVKVAAAPNELAPVTIVK